MKREFKFFNLLLALSVLMGCQVRDKSETNTNAATPQVAQESQRPTEGFFIQPHANKGYYEVIYYFPKFSGNIYLQLAKDSILVGPGDLGRIDLPIQFHSTEKEIEVKKVSANDGSEEKQIANLMLPQDLILDATYELSSDESWSYSRIYLEKDAAIYSKQFTLSIEASELISSGGVISHFAPWHQAPVGVAGLAGGSIALSLQKIQGPLKLIASGERGGTGAAGVPWESPAAAGAQGSPDEIANGGRGPNICVKPRESGAPGEHGAQGRSGANGSTGGDSGTIDLRYVLSENLKIFRTHRPGIGGDGGQGGPGQIGGAGGAIGRAYLHPTNENICMTSVRVGPTGANGARGEKGAPGLNGNPSSAICITQGEQPTSCQ